MLIRLVGPGGAGKTTIGSHLAARLHVAFRDLDRSFTDDVGDIGEFIDRFGYDAYARKNVDTYCALIRSEPGSAVIALSSGFMTYSFDIHPEYTKARHDIEKSPTTFVLLPSLDRDVCAAETVRRQLGRPFSRSAATEERVIRRRFDAYMAICAEKIETMRPVAAIVDEIVAAMPVGPSVRFGP